MSPTSTRFTKKNKPISPWLVFFILLTSLLLATYLSMRFGAVSYSHKQVWQTLLHPLISTDLQDVIWDIRLPRIVAAACVGAALAQAGTIMQGLTRNPIADPGLLGINAGAGLALVIGYLILPSMHYSFILLFCLVGAVLAAIVVFGLAYQPKQGFQPMRLILVGAMMATLFQTLGQALIIRFHLSSAVIGWQSGGLVATNWKMVTFIAPFILVGMIVAQLFSYQLSIISMNDTLAKSLGQRTKLMSFCLFAIVLILSAAAVALVGSLAFVGLIIPHLMRMVVPRDYRLLLPMSALAGASFLVWVDLVCRTFNPPYETPLNALISMIGFPWFLWLIRKGKHL